MSTTPGRHRRSFAPSARNAKTSPGDWSTSTLLVASGIDAAPGEQRPELGESALPAHLVRRRSVAFGKVGVGEDELGSVSQGVELDGHERLGSVGCGTA